MPTRPDDLPTWATAPAPGDLVEPSAALQAAGWVFQFIPPHNFVNWFWNLVYQWILFVSESAQVFDDLTEAVDYADANLSPGDMLVVYEDDSATGPAVEEIEELSGANGPEGGLDACGDLVVFSIGTFDNKGVNRDLTGAGPSGTPIAIYARTNTGQNRAIKTNGAITVQAYGNFVEAFNALTGASLWVHDNDTPVNDLTISAGFVYIVHGATAGTGDATAARQMHKLVLSTGVVVWSLEHGVGDELRSVCTNGRQVFVAGTASSFASGANMRAIVAADGFDATGECNNGADTEGLAWDRVDATIHGVGRVMDCDGTMLYSGYPKTAAFQLEFIGQGDGVSRVQIAHPDANANAAYVSCDQDYVYMCTTNGVFPEEGFVEAYDKRTGTMAWRFASSGGTPAHSACVAAVSDGSKLFVLGDAETRIWRVTRGNVPVRHRVIDADTELVRYRNWKLQPEVQ